MPRSRHSVDPIVLLVLVCGVAFAVMLIVFAVSASINTVRSVAFRYEVIGAVDHEPEGKTFGSAESGMTTKFSVRLKDSEGRISIVNCTSTQCASLSVGDKVQLSCYNEWNGFVQPTEIECRYDALITAAPAATDEHKK